MPTIRFRVLVGTAHPTTPLNTPLALRKREYGYWGNGLVKAQRLAQNSRS